MHGFLCKYLILLCISCNKFSGYQFQLSLLCYVLLYKNHKNSFENIRTASQNWDFSYTNHTLVGIQVFTQNQENPDEIGMVGQSAFSTLTTNILISASHL